LTIVSSAFAANAKYIAKIVATDDSIFMFCFVCLLFDFDASFFLAMNVYNIRLVAFH